MIAHSSPRNNIVNDRESDDLADSDRPFSWVQRVAKLAVERAEVEWLEEVIGSAEAEAQWVVHGARRLM